MKRYILTLILTSLTLWLAAVPAMRIRKSVTLDDGRTVMVTAYGDENLDFLVTDDGEVVIEQGKVFHATGLNREEYVASLPTKPAYLRRQVGSLANALIQPYGVKKIPVILAAFKDKPFTAANSDSRVKAFYNTFFNGENIENTTGNYGSVRQYFIDQSQGQFMPEFTIIGPVELDSVYSYYGEQDTVNTKNKDKHYSDFVKESFTKAVAMEENWMEFDNNNDGKVDMCVIIFAGMGQNYTNSYGDKNTIWPQEMPASYTINGITLSGCSTSCEMRPTAANDSIITDWQADGIGVVVHEISHAIGLPDLYDTNYKAFGLDFWSIMDYGMYTRQSKFPVGYTAYEREFMKWQMTETITEPTTLRLSCFHQGGKGYKLVNDANPQEYYILDNRQAMGWDWGVCSNRGHGMLVMHVDYNSGIWTSNRVNANPNHQYLTIIPANNSLIGSNNAMTGAQWKESLLGNPFPGITDNHELTDESIPASTVYAGEFMHKPIVDIQESAAGIITLKVMPLGTLEAPADTWFEDVKPGGALAVWEPVENAALYNFQLWSEGELVLQQDSIATPSYRLTNLPMDVNYTYRVQAINDAYRNSEWMESETFRADPDAISEITESMELVRIYEMNGRLVCECFADELYRLSLQRGIYIVRYYDGRTKKVMI